MTLAEDQGWRWPWLCRKCQYMNIDIKYICKEAVAIDMVEGALIWEVGG